MEGQIVVPEADGDVAPTPIPDGKLQAQLDATQQRAATHHAPAAHAQQDPETGDLPTRSPFFNNMADKLNSAMNDLNAPAAPAQNAQTPPAQTAQTPPAATPTTEPPKAPDALDDDLPFTRAKAADWAKLKGVISEWKNKATDYEKKLLERDKLIAEEVAKSKSAEAERLASIQKEHEERGKKLEAAEEQLRRFALEHSDEFNGHFQKKLDAALARAKEAAGDKAEDVEHLILLNPSKSRKAQLEAITEGLGHMDATLLAQAAIEFDSVRAQKSEELKNAKDNYAKLQSMRAEKEKMRAAEMSKETERYISTAAEVAKQFEWAKPNQTDAAQVAFAKEKLAENEAFVRGTLEPEVLFKIQPKAAAYDWLAPKYDAAMKRIAELENAVKEYEAVKAPPSGGPPPNAQPQIHDSSDRPFMRKFMEAYNAP